MFFICDVHIPYKLVSFLVKSGYQSIHVNQILNGSESKDIDIAIYADMHRQIVISKDEDFENLHFARRTPLKLVRVLLGNTSTTDLIAIFEKHLPEIAKLNVFERFYVEIGKNQFMYTTEYELD